MYYLDPLYGQLEFDNDLFKLFQTPALTRIRDISLSAVPPLATPSGMIGSRFEHSVGVAYLSQLLTLRPEFEHLKKDLLVASLFHDTGSPPFSHITERIMSDITGKDHEEFAQNAIFSKDNSDAIKKFGADPQTVYRLITGEYAPWSDLINGSIDLDNIDNSLRWGSAIGIIPVNFYDPKQLLHAYMMSDGKLALKGDFIGQIQKWELCRRLVYDVVYSDLNLTPETMLFRAMQFAFENKELDEHFFDLTDSQALYTLEHRCNPQTQNLIHDMRAWRFYKPAGEVSEVDKVSEIVQTLCTSWTERQKIADILSDSLSIPRECVTVYAGKDKGFKKIHLPFIGPTVQTEHEPIQKLCWRIKIYLHPDHEDKGIETEELLKEIILG